MSLHKTRRGGTFPSATPAARPGTVDVGADSDMMRWFNGLQPSDQARVGLAWQHGWWSGWDDHKGLHRTVCPFVPNWGPADG